MSEIAQMYQQIHMLQTGQKEMWRNGHKSDEKYQSIHLKLS